MHFLRIILFTTLNQFVRPHSLPREADSTKMKAFSRYMLAILLVTVACPYLGVTEAKSECMWSPPCPPGMGCGAVMKPGCAPCYRCVKRGGSYSCVRDRKNC